STALAYLWALDLLEPYGQGAMICGRDRLAREVLNRPEAEGIYAVVDVEGPLFEDVELPTSIAFFVQPKNRRDRRYAEAGERQSERESALYERFSAYRADLESLAEDVRSARRLAAGLIQPGRDNEELQASFRAVASEYRRRRKTESRGADDSDDVDLTGGRIRVRLRAYNKLVLARSGRLQEIELLRNQSPAYFGQNKRAWRQLLQAEEEGLLSVSEALKKKVAAEAEEAERQSTPLFPVPPQMRLGWLTDLERITCTKGDPDYGFVAGQSYNLSTRSKVKEETEQRAVENRHGEPEIRQFKTQRKLLEVRIGEHAFDEGAESIEYITEHFDLPDPGCVATRHPEEVARNRRILDQMELEIRANYDRYMREHGETEFEPFSYKEFQKDHMSRLLVKRRGMLAHEQGLGKSLEQMSLAEANVRLGAKNQVLYVVPQDLIPQMAREAKKFFGRELEEIRTPAQGRDVARRIARGEHGWWITYYEALSIVGRKNEELPVAYLDHRVALAHRLAEYKATKRKQEGQDAEKVDYAAIEQTLGVGLMGATTRDACPNCGADTSQGWDSESCGECHYAHRSLYRKTAVSHLTTAFKGGVVCVDEVSEIRGDDSLRSKAVRALFRGPFKFGSTGTPLSNFLSDSFYPLIFSLGANSTAFPYSFGPEGKQRFEADYCVVEHMMGRAEDGEAGVKKRRKILPQITNVSQFWRLAQPGVSRCRKEQTGEPLVARTFHPVRVPMGSKQKKMHDFWLDNFTDYFEWKFPAHELVK
ncbi:MAG: SNF2-related protein, partial [Rubrobacter sp.]|nr:SNF2-related protein [Rubrobacter sp.]